MNSRQARITLIAMAAVMALNAFGGAWYAIDGASEWPREWLDGSPFGDFVVPGLILGIVVGGSQLLAAFALLRRWPSAQRITRAASAILFVWIVTQLALIGYVSPLQPIVLCWSIGTFALARRYGPVPLNR